MRLLKGALIGVFLCQIFSLEAASLDGTAGVVYQKSSYSFANGDYARGFVRLNDGFSVPAGGTVSCNLLSPVAGNIDLNGTGKISLDGDFHLASNGQFDDDGGVIDGQGQTIFLGGNLAIPAGTVLKISGDTIINGQGHVLVFEDGAPGGQILIDGPEGTTLVLRNIIIRGLKGYTTDDQAIAFGTSDNQILILDNATVHLGDNFIFEGGQLHISNHVSFQGPYWFDFQASYNCWIYSNSTLFFDFNTAFLYRPIDYSKYHLVFSDDTSRLFLRGSTLYAPGDTGLKFTKGHLIVDHKSDLQSDAPTADDEPMQFGRGIVHPEDDFKVDILPGAKLGLVDAILVYKNQT